MTVIFSISSKESIGSYFPAENEEQEKGSLHAGILYLIFTIHEYNRYLP
jgi:hypothetical protein